MYAVLLFTYKEEPSMSHELLKVVYMNRRIGNVYLVEI